MRESKLYNLLKDFSKVEQNRFRKYLQSPYFNRSQALLDLFEFLIKDINGASSKEPSKEKIWKIINPGEPFDDVRYRKFFSDLLKLGEGFLVQEVFDENELEKANYLMQAVNKRKLDTLYPTSIRAARRVSGKFPQKGATHYLNEYKIEQNIYDLTDFDSKRAERYNLDEMSINLDCFYIIEKLRLYLTALTQKVLIANHDYQINFTEEILEDIPQSNLIEVPAVQLYLLACRLFKEPENLENYHSLKKELIEKIDGLWVSEAQEIYEATIGYAIQRLNSGRSEFLEELFDLYGGYIEMEVKNRGVTPAFHFRNTVVVGLRLGRYEWVEAFINQYGPLLPKDQQENAITFNLAQLYFYQNKYQKVLDQLRNVEYDDISYNLNSKTILIATYYELDEFDPLESLLESFRVYLNRKQDIPESRRANFKNLIKYTKRLTRIIPSDAKAVEKLKKEVKENKKIASRKWLLDKIAELES